MLLADLAPIYSWQADGLSRSCWTITETRCLDLIDDPWVAQTWDHLCGAFDRLRPFIKAELRRRLPRNGEVLMGTALLDPSGVGTETLTKGAIERAWGNRE